MGLQDVVALGMITVVWVGSLIYGIARNPRSSTDPVPGPLLTRTPRPCPSCGGESYYHWEPGWDGGHRLRCQRCRDVYTTNAGAETRWSITEAGGMSELCFAVDEEQAAKFVEKVLLPAAPGAAFEVRLGADNATPYCGEYVEAPKQIYVLDRRRLPVKH